MAKESYRNSVAAIIINKNRKILMCEHAWIDDAWQLPQGGVEGEETEDEAILRELEEELGSSKFEIIDKMPEKLTYKFPYYLKDKYHFDGQIQSYFLIYFHGEDRELRFDNQPKPEFKNYEWVDISEPPLRVIYFKKISYLKAIEYFRKTIEQFEENQLPSKKNHKNA